jgi:hypothetical protein
MNVPRRLLAALLGTALSTTGAAQTATPTLSSPTSPESAPAADGFIPRWLLLEPIAAAGLTDSAVQAAVKKEYFRGQLTVVPHDGDTVTVGDAPLRWHAVDTKLYNVNLFHFARAQGKPTSPSAPTRLRSGG